MHRRSSEDEPEGDVDLGAVELIRSSPEALEDAGTAHMEMTIEAGPGTIEAAGQFDFAAQTGAMTMSLPAPAGELEMVFDGTTYFMRADAFGGAIPGRRGMDPGRRRGPGRTSPASTRPAAAGHQQPDRRPGRAGRR